VSVFVESARQKSRLKLCRNTAKRSKATASLLQKYILTLYKRSQRQQDSMFLLYLLAPVIRSWLRRWPTLGRTRHCHRSCTYQKYFLVGECVTVSVVKCADVLIVKQLSAAFQ